MIVTCILLLSLLLPRAQDAPHRINILLVSPPGESWTQSEQARAIGAVQDAAAWWSRNSAMPVPTFELGWTAIITPTDFSYSLFVWEQSYYTYPPADVTVFVIDNSESHKTMAGAIGWAQVPCQAITTLLSNSQDELGAIVAHEYGHAVLGLDHAPLAAFDIMAPTYPLAAYKADTIGYYTRLAMGETFHKVYIP
jgi:Zn-dependent protease with chaperone function